MRVSRVIHSLGSGIIVYVVATACGAASDNIGVGLDGGGTNPDATIDSVVDSLLNPVPTASAQVPPPDVATEACDKTLGYSGTTYRAAVHAYPGKTARELASVHAVVHYASADYHAKVGDDVFDYAPAAVLLRDGAVAVNCGHSSSAVSVDSVTFVLAR